MAVSINLNLSNSKSIKITSQPNKKILRDFSRRKTSLAVRFLPFQRLSKENSDLSFEAFLKSRSFTFNSREIQFSEIFLYLFSYVQKSGVYFSN